MWFFPTKKEVKKEFSKIFNAFKKRDVEIQEIKKDMLSRKEVELMIREAVIDLKVQSGQYTEPKSEPRQKQRGSNFERAVMKKAQIVKPEAIKNAIRGLLARDLKTTEIYNHLVNEKGLCGKTQFYHYLSLVRNEVRSLVRTEPRAKL